MALRRQFVGVAAQSELGVTFRVSRDRNGNVITSSTLDTVIALDGSLVVPTWDLSMLNTPVASAPAPTSYIKFRLVDDEQK